MKGVLSISFGPELVWIWNRELKKHIGKRVQKLEGGDSWVAVSISGSTVLLLSWGAQNCGIAVISDKEKKDLISSARQTPPIVNALKSNISGAELTDVCQLNRDRIIRLTFTKTIGAGFSNTRHLILETMERYSNLILLDENDMVLETAKHIHPADNRFRSVLPGQPYSMPPEFKGIALEEWLEHPSSETLRSVAGFGKKLLERFAEMEVERAARYLNGFYKNETDISSYIPQLVKKYLTALPELLEGASAIQDTTIADTGRIIVLSPIADVSLNRRRKVITDQIERETVRRERQIGDIEKLLHEEDAEKYKKYGDALVANSWQITPGAEKACVTYWDSEGNEVRETVPLDPRLSAAKNSARYFAKYKKIISAQERAAKVLIKVKEELEDLREQMAIIQSMDDTESLALVEEELGIKNAKQRNVKKKTAAPLPPHKRFDLEYALVFVGFSSKGNRYVTFKLANADDIWFHAQGVPGAHVILRFTSAPTEEEKDKAIKFCASLAAKYSRNGDNPGQRVDYTLRKYVSPIKGGEANVTYRNFSSIAAGELRHLEALA